VFGHGPGALGHRPGTHRPGGLGHRPGHRPGGLGHRPGGLGHRPSGLGHRPGHRPGLGHRPGGLGGRHIGLGRPGFRHWARPRHYWWRRGGAVAAGAALGYVAAGVASSWAGVAPGPNMCWYYTDATRRQGFWDECPDDQSQ
jgi:hypothetical protein